MSDEEKLVRDAEIMLWGTEEQRDELFVRRLREQGYQIPLAEEVHPTVQDGDQVPVVGLPVKEDEDGNLVFDCDRISEMPALKPIASFTFDGSTWDGKSERKVTVQTDSVPNQGDQ